MITDRQKEGEYKSRRITLEDSLPNWLQKPIMPKFQKMYFQIKLMWILLWHGSLHTHTHTHTHIQTHTYFCISMLCVYIYIHTYIVFDHSHKNGKIFPFLWLWFDAMMYCQNFRHDTLSAVFPFFDTWKFVNRYFFSLTHETLSAVFCPKCYVCNVLLKSCKIFVVLIMFYF